MCPGSTPLHFAVDVDRPESAQLLLILGQDMIFTPNPGHVAIFVDAKALDNPEILYNCLTYLPHKAVAEVSKDKEPIGRECAEFNWFESQLMSDSNELRVK